MASVYDQFRQQIQRRGVSPGSMISTGLFNPQSGDPRLQAHMERMRQLGLSRQGGGGQPAPAGALKGPSSLGLGRPGARTTASNVIGGSLGATRAGLGQLQGPPTAQRKMLFPGQDPRRDIFGGRQFGSRTRTARTQAREFLRRGSFGQGGGFQRNPMSFGILGKGAGRLGQRIR